MADVTCTPSWRFTTDPSAGPPHDVPFHCGGGFLCPRPGPHGTVDLGLVVAAGQPGIWTLVRDGDKVLIDKGSAPVVGAYGHGDDGCGHAGAMYLMNDPTPFGFHQYVLDNPIAGIHEVQKVLAAGPGADAL